MPYCNTEPTIRMSILDTVSVLLDHHSRLCRVDSENGLENEERLFDVPIRMVSDINQKVCVCVCVCAHVCVCLCLKPCFCLLSLFPYISSCPLPLPSSLTGKTDESELCYLSIRRSNQEQR